MGAIVTGGRGAPFFPSGMFKNGASATLGTSFALVTTWTADTGPYPGSSVVSNGLIVQSTRAGAKVSCSVVASSAAAGGGTVQVRLKLGATVLITSGSISVPGFGGTNTVALNFTTDVVLNDAVTLEALASSGSSMTIVTGVNSWVRITES
ncbi:hypothetical protein ACTWPB_07695 [Nocardia sp. IBHARD005]|uniref:hypothetical protein n=1 Tax=Nocardia sp. IBHARD005 TaxID=3457765 RepID=UPI00405A0E1B